MGDILIIINLILWILSITLIVLCIKSTPQIVFLGIHRGCLPDTWDQLHKIPESTFSLFSCWAVSTTPLWALPIRVQLGSMNTVYPAQSKHCSMKVGMTASLPFVFYLVPWNLKLNFKWKELFRTHAWVCDLRHTPETKMVLCISLPTFCDTFLPPSLLLHPSLSFP